MAIGVDGIVLSMKSPETGEYLTANVYTVDGVYEPGTTELRRLSIGQLVMALCLKRAASLETDIISKMNQIESVSEQLELMTKIETDILVSSIDMSSKTVSYQGTTYTYYWFLTEVMGIDDVPTGTASKDSTELLTNIESKMDENNSLSQKTMIELQSQTNKRDQTYDMISNSLKSINTVLVGTANNM